MEAASVQVKLRAYRAEDMPSLIEIDREFQREAGFGTPERPFFEHTDYTDIVGVYLNTGGAFWVIETADRTIAAFGGVLPVDQRTARLRRFRVRERWRRRGLATRLLLTAERFCRERGHARITLGTTDQQQAAQALYRKHGYREVGERRVANDLREIEFVKELS